MVASSRRMWGDWNQRLHVGEYLIASKKDRLEYESQLHNDVTYKYESRVSFTPTDQGQGLPAILDGMASE